METLAVIAGLGTEIAVGYGLAKRFGLPIKPLVLTVIGAGLAGAAVSLAVRAASRGIK